MSTSRGPRYAALLAVFLTCALPPSQAFAQSNCDEAEVCYENGLAAFIGGEYGRAILLWKLGYKLDPKDGIFPYSMVAAYARTGQYEKAINLSRNVESDHDLNPKQATKNIARRLSYTSALAAKDVVRDLRTKTETIAVRPPPPLPKGYAFPSGRGVVGIGLTVVGAGLLGGMGFMNTQYGFQKSCVESPNSEDNLSACPRSEEDYNNFCNTAAAQMSTDQRIQSICSGQDRNIGSAITREEAEGSRLAGLILLGAGGLISATGLTLVIVDLLGAGTTEPQEATLSPVFMVQPGGAYTGFEWRF